MVDLPGVPRRLTTIQEPKSGLTARDIAAPYNSLARALDQAGEAAEAVAVPLAEEAGVASVRKDEAGNVVVDRGPLPMFGEAGKAFSRAARVTYLAQIEPQIANKATEMRLEYPNDPDGFSRAWDEYRKNLVAQAPDRIVRSSIDKVALREGGEAFRLSLVQTDRTNVTHAVEAYKNRLTGLDNRMAALARQGGTETAEYQQARADVQALYGELQGDKRFKYPMDRVVQELEAMSSRHRGEAIVGQAMRLHDKATPDAALQAKKYLQDAAFDPSLNLSTAERNQIVTRGMAALEGKSGANKALVEANRKLATETIEGLKSGAPYDDRRVNDLIDRSAQAGDVDSYYKLVAYRAYQPWRAAWAGLPVGEQIAAVGLLRSDNLTDRIIQAESGGDPNARARTSSAEGPGQFIRDTWRDLVRRHRPELVAGKSDDEVLALRRDPALSREMVAVYAQENAKRLEDARVPVNNATLYAAHFLGPGAAVATLKADPQRPMTQVLTEAVGQERAQQMIEANRRIFELNPTAGQLVAWAERKVGAGRDIGSAWGAAVRAELANDFTKKLGTEVERMVTTATTTLGQGRALGEEELTNIVRAIRITGRTDLIDKMDSAAKSYDAARGLTNAPANQRQALRAKLAAVAADRADPATREVIDQTEKTVAAIERGMAEKPYTTGAARGLHGPPAALVFEDASALAVAVDQRAGLQTVHRNHDGVGHTSIFEGQEPEAFRGFLARATPEQITGAFGALGRLDLPALTATLDNTTVKEAVTALSRSTEPGKFAAGMSALDQMYTRLGVQPFTKLFGEETAHAVMSWQSNLRYLDAKKLADERGKVLDPQVAEQRKRNEKEGLELARQKNVIEVTQAFDQSWFVTPGFVASSITGTKPDLPSPDVVSVSGLTRDAFMGDYQQLFSRRYSETLDKETAHKQTIELMKTKWQRSEVNGGRLMLHAPEAHYPMVDGSHTWATRQLEADLEARYGPMLGEGGVTVPTQRWTYALIPDRQTQADVQAGRPPSYMVAVTSMETEKTTVVTNDAGQPRRYRFDPAAAEERSEQRAGAQRRDYFETLARPLTDMGVFARPFEGGETPPSEGRDASGGLSVMQKGFLSALKVAEDSGLGGTALKIYNDVVQRGRTAAITESDLPTAEREGLKSMVLAHAEKSGRKSGRIDYPDYAGSGVDHNILGGFKYEVSGDTVTITDTYDFNISRAGVGEANVFAQALASVVAPRNMAASIGRKVVPDAGGKGVPVKIVLR